MSPGGLLGVAASLSLAGIVVARRHSRTWLALTVAGAAAALAAALSVLLSPLDWEWRSGWPLGGEPAHLRLDGLSALFLVLLCVVGGSGAVYSRVYFSDQEHPAAAARGRAWWSAMLLSMGAVLVCSNGLHFLIAWEAFALCGYYLITLQGERREVRAAGWLYLAASHTGTMCLFAFFAALAARAGSWDLGPLPASGHAAPLFWLALFGFGMKAGFFPLHLWLPSAHASAPSHVSALMSGVAIKMGVYGIVRFSGWLPVPAAAGWVVIGLGSVGALLGIVFALAQDDLKRLLAYCSVEHVGVILIGLGAALLAVSHDQATWGTLALAGALLHVWNHGAFKSLLFFGAGAVLHATGTRELSRLGGLWRAMPWTASLFALGAMAVVGLPPLNGFVGEWLLYLGLFEAASLHQTPGWATMPAAILLAMAGALALAAFLKASGIVFLGAGRTQAVAAAHECGPLMRGPMLLLAGLCLAIGLAPAACWPVLARAVGSWHPAWGSSPPPAALQALGPVHRALAVLAVLAAVVLLRQARAHGLRRGLTWDCGYRAPTARMQYTSGSFAAVAGGWFAWILRPERRLRRPRGLFPLRAGRRERVPEAVLEHVLMPAGGAVLAASQLVRRLQHGGLQAYILYLVLGLTGLAALVLLGGSR